MLHILHLTLASDAGGLSRYIADISAAAVAQGHRVTVAGDVGAWQWLFDQSPVTYVKIPLKREAWRFARSRAILQSALNSIASGGSGSTDRPPVDVIHTHYRRATLLGRRLQRDWTASIGSAPQLLYTLHLSHISLRFGRRWLSDFGDMTHCASVDARDWLINQARVPPQRIALIPHGVDVSRYVPPSPQWRQAVRESMNLGPNDRVVLYVGRLDRPKNEEWLLDVAVACRAAGMANLKVLLAGEGPHELPLKQRIADLGLQGVVRLLGHVQALPVYQAADALLLPSEREGFSLVCAEAMATGVPVLRTRTSGTTELILEGVTGRSVPINRAAFVAAAVEFLKDGDALARMGAAASRHVREHFTFDRQAADTLALYARLAAQTPSGG